MKRIRKRILPVFLVIILLFGLMPTQALALTPDFSTEVTGEVEGGTSSAESTNTPPSDDGPDISITPGDGSNAPEPPSESAVTEDASTPDNPENEPVTGPSVPASDGEDIVGNSLDGATVILENGINAGLARIGIQATGTLSVTKIEAYRWNFTYPQGGTDMQPWYIIDIDGKMAYCVEPTNPVTYPGSYQTLDYTGLNGNQQLAVGYAMLYGAQDGSDPLNHMATQVVIWEICLGYLDLTTLTTVNKSSYDATIGFNPGAAPYYDQIITSMRSHTQVPSFTRFVEPFAPLHTVPGVAGEYKLDLVNTNPGCDLADFAFENSGTVSFVREGQTLHVTSTAPLDGSTTYAGIKGSMDALNSLIFWCSGADQIRATGHCDPVTAFFRLATSDIGEYSITITKLQAGTNIPLAGAEFEVRHTEKGIVGTFTTDGSGTLTVSVPWQGSYIVTELTPPDGHLLDENPMKDVVISTDKPTASLTFHNASFSGIQIRKVDSETGEPLAGATFRIADNGGLAYQDIVSGADGIARLTGLEPGHYTITEILAPKGYILNDQPQVVEILEGRAATITMQNTPMPGLMLQKIDSVTGKGMAGVVFEIEKVDGQRIGNTYTTDAGGYIFIPDITEETFVIVREIATLPGYRIDTAEKLVQLEYGKLTKVVFENSPYPYLVIQKVDAGTKAPLPGTTFKLMDVTGREIGCYTTNQQGRIVLTGIDAGSYKLQETAAAPGYVLDDRVWDITLEWGKTTTVTFKNVPLEIKVEVEKRGPVEAIAGQEIQYDFRNIANLSSVALDEFYWHDLLPTDAVRLVYITTGTWSEDLTYSVVYRTNLKDTWTTLAEDLITSVNHKLECSAQVLGLASNEYVTEFKFLFGTVQPGFREVKQPTVGCRVLADLPDSYQFTNRTDVGGKYGGKWTYDKDHWTTVVYKTPDRGTLPKTGVWV